MKKPLTITVMTDIHHYAKSTGITGAAYEVANAKSQVFLEEAGMILQGALDQAAADDRSDIVLISGDVTSNAEYDSHDEVIAMLRDLKSKGKRVYVITATHDFRNSKETPAYRGDQKIMIPARVRDELFDMYREFGPDEAISVHRESMSYIVQLCDGYRLFALNDDTNKTGKSGFSDECFEWITQQVEDAKKNDQFIIAMTHHPLISPSPLYSIVGKGDMLGDYDVRINQLADLGVQFILTGHTHIHNISAHQTERGNVIYDIATGSPIGYPGVMRSITLDPNNDVVKVSTDFVKEPENFKSSQGDTLDVAFVNQAVGAIKGMIDAAGKDIDMLADKATSISIKPKLIYKIGWLIKPVFKILNSLKIKTVAKWTKKETGLKPADYEDIKNIKVVDVISDIVLNLFGGKSAYPPETPTYKITMGVMKIADSILRTLHIDLKKLLKVVPDASSLIEPLLFNPIFDSYNSDLKIMPYIPEGEKGEKLELPRVECTVKDSKKGPAIIIVLILILLIFLPVWILLLLGGFIVNQIKYGKKLK